MFAFLGKIDAKMYTFRFISLLLVAFNIYSPFVQKLVAAISARHIF